MKKAAKIILTITGIIDIIAAVLYILTAFALILFIGPFVLLFVVPFIIWLLLGIFALGAAKAQTKGKFITVIVFAILAPDWISLVGAILGLIGCATEKKHEEKHALAKYEDDGEEYEEKMLPEEKPLSGAGKGLKIGAKVCLGLAALGSLLSILACILFVLGGLGFMVYGVVTLVMQMMPVLSTITWSFDFESMMNQGQYLFEYIMNNSLLLNLAIYSASGLFILLVGLFYTIPCILSFIFSLVGACTKKNKKGTYICNIVFGLLSLTFLEVLGGILGTIGVSLKKKN